MFVQIMAYLVATAVIGTTVWQARRYQHRGGSLKQFRLLWGFALLAFVGYSAASALAMLDLAATEAAVNETINTNGDLPSRVMLATGLSILVALTLWWLTTSKRAATTLGTILPPAQEPWASIAQPWNMQIRGFDADSLVHLLAIALAGLFFSQTLIDFVIAGGQAGLAIEGLKQSEILVSSAMTALLLLTVTLTGIGLWQDRSLRDTMTRLGLRVPKWEELTVGGGTALTLIAFQFCAGTLWMMVTPESVFDQQTQLSQAISSGVTTIYGAFLVALFSSVAEEIAFRGALQPVIGLVPTSILFALTHLQYQLTPATIIILVVGLTFGWVRQHYGTLAAITSHFFYNFLLLLLAVAASNLLP